MAGFTYATLTTAILNYTEVDNNVLTSTITDQFIENSELRILRDVPIDAYKKQKIGNLVTGQNTINVPAQTLFVKGVQVYTSTSASTGANTWLEKKDETYLQEFQPSTTTQFDGINVTLTNAASSTETGGGFQCTIGPVNDRG